MPRPRKNPVKKRDQTKAKQKKDLQHHVNKSSSRSVQLFSRAKPRTRAQVATEYYPDKLKRKIERKQMVLRSRTVQVTVGRLNKRKRSIPRRGVSRSPSPLLRFAPIQPEEPEKTVEELIQLTETEGLTDDDLYEILTCPSPVWWETLEGIDEEPIMKSNIKMKDEDKKPTADETDIAILPIIKCDDKFLKKRNVLENILSLIKNKTTKVNTDVSKSNDSNRNTQKSSIIKVIKTTYKEMMKQRESEIGDADKKAASNGTVTKEAKERITVSTTEDVKEADKSASNQSEERIDELIEKNNKVERVKEIIAKDKAQVEGTNEEDPNKKEESKRVNIDNNEEEVLNIEMDENDMIQISKTNPVNMKDKTVKSISRKRKFSFETDYVALECLENIDVPVDKKLKIEGDVIMIDCPTSSDMEETADNDSGKKIDSPESTNDGTSDSTTQDGCDTISDTNIQFLTSDQISDEDSANALESIPESSLESDEETQEDDENSSVASKTTDETESEKNKRLNRPEAEATEEKEKLTSEMGGKNDFCKQCREKTKINSKVMNDEIVLYCSKCLTIFDSKPCGYCNATNEVLNSESSLICQICFCQCCCEDSLKEHVTNHIGAM